VKLRRWRACQFLTRNNPEVAPPCHSGTTFKPDCKRRYWRASACEKRFGNCAKHWRQHSIPLPEPGNLSDVETFCLPIPSEIANVPPPPDKESKLGLFRSLFRGREDVYEKRFSHEGWNVGGYTIHDRKKVVRVYDYVDTQVPMLARIERRFAA